ncbi:MAG TPA: 50S ribosomal protein L25/general stress protein Ctc [Hyphomicrobiales bacterium]|nr:50S ribosomal protein L25/general stress protein Ctc [Hyphomicrobiales bacterium]
MTRHEIVLEAQARDNVGKGASRRLRLQQDAVPAIVYGGEAAPANIALSHNKLLQAVDNEAFFSSIITLKIDGNAQSVVIKDLQRHPSKPRIMHADFLRVQADHVLHVKVPLRFLNEATAVGVKQGGGLVMRLVTEIEVSCLPKDLPEFIEVDLVNLAVGQSLHISDLKLPQGVSSIALSHGAEGDLGVVTITAPQKSAEPEADAAAADKAEKK